MSRLTNRIIALRESGLISLNEARSQLRHLAAQSKFNADYADHPDSYKRWTNEARAAATAARAPLNVTIEPWSATQ